MDTKAAERTAVATTEGLSATQVQALNRLVTNLTQPGSRGADPIAAVLKAIAEQAAEEGITDADIEAELAAYNLERRI